MNKVGLEEPESYPIIPAPGWLVVAKDAGTKCPVFINICSHDHIPVREIPIVFTVPCRIHRNEWLEESYIYDAVVHSSTVSTIFEVTDEAERSALQNDLSTKVVDMLKYQGELGELIPMANGAEFAVDSCVPYKFTSSEVMEVRLPGSEPVAPEMSEEEAATYNFWRSFKVTCKRAFEDSVPMHEILDLRPKLYMYGVGIGGMALAVVVFGYFMYEAFNATMNQKYLALSADDGGECEEVTKSVSGTFSADKRGNWQGFEGFSNPGVQFLFELRASALTTAHYENLMTDFLAEVSSLGELSVTQDLASNLILLSTWNFHCDPLKDSDCALYETQTVRMAAEAPVVFAMSDQVAGISSEAGDCSTAVDARYDLPSAMYRFSINGAAFEAIDECQGVIGSPSRFGYNRYTDGDSFAFNVDVRTFASAVSVNKGFGSLRAQARYEIILSSGISTIAVGGHQYSAAYYIDTSFPGMLPLYCMVDSELPSTFGEYPLPLLTDDGLGVNQLCLLPLGDIVVLPLFNHYGDNPKGPKGPDDPLDTPRPCTCDMYGSEPYCSDFDLMMSFVAVNNDSKNATAAEQMALIIDMTLQNSGYDSLTRNSYNASFASAATSSGRVDPAVATEEYRRNSYHFCDGTCALLTMNTYGQSVLDISITPFMHVLSGGSCGDTFTIPDADTSKLRTEPTPFVESYFVCTSSVDDAIVEAVGVASGTAGTFLPLIMTITLLIIRKWLKMNGYMLGAPEYDSMDLRTKRREFVECLLTARGLDPDKPEDHHRKSKLPAEQQACGFHALGEELWTQPKVRTPVHSASYNIGHELSPAARAREGFTAGPPVVDYLSDSESSTENSKDGEHNRSDSPIALFDELSFNSDLLESESGASSDGINELFEGDGRSEDSV